MAECPAPMIHCFVSTLYALFTSTLGLWSDVNIYGLCRHCGEPLQLDPARLCKSCRGSWLVPTRYSEPPAI